MSPPGRESRPSRASGAAPQKVRRAGADGAHSTAEHRQNEIGTLFDAQVSQDAYGRRVTFDIAAAATKERHRAGRDRAEANRDQWWWDGAMRAVRAMAATGNVFQAYDVAIGYGLPDADDNRSRWGALLATAARRGYIVPVGAEPSKRPETAGSLVRTWRGRGTDE